MNMHNVPRGVIRTDPVGSIDIFPTVVYLATGIDLPRGSIVDDSGLPLDGQNLVRPNNTRPYTFAQYPRCQNISTDVGWQCINGVYRCQRLPNTFMGFMVRTVDTKYVEWRHFQDYFTTCARPNWPRFNKVFVAKTMPVWQIDPTKTFTIWNRNAVQREMFENYPTTTDFQWGDWEMENVLVSRLGNQNDTVTALQLSVAIRWRFDPTFAPQGASEPCSGNGYVRLSNPSLWTNFNVQPSFQQVYCLCFNAWTGAICDQPK